MSAPRAPTNARDGSAELSAAMEKLGAEGSQTVPEDPLKQNRNIAIIALVIGVVGALGVGLRPILEKRFAANAARQTAIAAANRQTRVVTNAEQQHLQQLLHRLHYLQARHLVRHPMWYGFVPSDPRVQAAAASLEQFEAKGQQESNQLR
jgi:hypothetical protein